VGCFLLYKYTQIWYNIKQMKRTGKVQKRGSNMRKKILTAVVAIVFGGQVAIAQCDCLGGTIIFTEDPLILAEEDVDFHTEVDEVYFDAGECVVFLTFPDGMSSSYREATGHEVQKLTLSAQVAEHPAFAGLPAEVTLAEVSSAAAAVCWPALTN